MRTNSNRKELKDGTLPTELNGHGDDRVLSPSVAWAPPEAIRNTAQQGRQRPAEGCLLRFCPAGPFRFNHACNSFKRA